MNKEKEVFDALLNGQVILLVSFSQFQDFNFTDKLKNLLFELNVSVQFIGVEKYFDDDKEKRTILKVIIKRNGKEINFTYGCSLYNTELFVKENYSSGYISFQREKYFNTFEFIRARNKARDKFIDSLLYDILTCCKNDFYCSIDFEEFCSEFGYSADSIQAEKIWKKCLKQSSKLQKIFSDSEIECLSN